MSSLRQLCEEEVDLQNILRVSQDKIILSSS